MRVVAGSLGGRRLLVPKGRNIRPTSDKIRGAIFNALESMGAVRDARVLDGFCGTGALGIEALSRGAASCVFADKARTSLDLARQNVEALGLQDQAVFQHGDLAGSFVMRNQNPFSLVLLDPPYYKDLIFQSLEYLISIGVLGNDTICIAEGEKDLDLHLNGSFTVLSQKTYGDTCVLFLRYAP